ncbi:hypothetical protein K457DRAFT_561815 [Linnemannia elongata AG-77]|uniref:Uncharacterized protein n=1 Tax=Linnemannia elongata AG-77 TaxID=1314771 RepID=A0A197JTW1_9FUNG|nr:hypothetical protein K457DRAFT_561815 [Linnemannia elongata AG-77]
MHTPLSCSNICVTVVSLPVVPSLSLFRSLPLFLSPSFPLFLSPRSCRQALSSFIMLRGPGSRQAPFHVQQQWHLSWCLSFIQARPCHSSACYRLALDNVAISAISCLSRSDVLAANLCIRTVCALTLMKRPQFSIPIALNAARGYGVDDCL